MDNTNSILPMNLKGAPFWGLNGKLDLEELKKQIDVFYDMGFGGVHFHPRTGLDTKYMGKEYLNCIKECAKYLRKKGMYVYLYDEDRWPSGYAGGFVTKEHKYRQRQLLFTPFPYGTVEIDSNPYFSVTHTRSENGQLIACYDIVLDDYGYIASANRIGANDNAQGTKWYAYSESARPSAWFNGYTYADLLNSEAMERFIEETHEKYAEILGDEFGKTVISIFSDEPQVTFKQRLSFASEKRDLLLAWTDRLPEKFKSVYNMDLLDYLPELFWEKRDGYSKARYLYHELIAQLFADTYGRICGDWCKKHNIKMSGHLLEQTPNGQAQNNGDVMRVYPHFGTKGIDLLADEICPECIKPAQSVVHQSGDNEMLAELYGVTQWGFNYSDHKFQGDWLAALGVTFRAHHLSMYTMKGEGKRDYPASIGYQLPWYKEYRSLEDYYTRIAEKMTKGKPVVKIAVINPVESAFLLFGCNEQLSIKRQQLDSNYKQLSDWLLNEHFDYDFISEALLPSQLNNGKIGEMDYEVIIVPNVITLRSTTIACLKELNEKGKKIIFLGSYPQYTDASKAEFSCSDMPLVRWDKCELIKELNPYRSLSIINRNGSEADDLIYNLRKDNKKQYLFIAHIVKNKDLNPQKINVVMPGKFNVHLYDTATGTYYKTNTRHVNDCTHTTLNIYSLDSVLLEYCDSKTARIQKAKQNYVSHTYAQSPVRYELNEPNVCLLDCARYKIGDAPFGETENILRIDDIIRTQMGLLKRCDVVKEPWTIQVNKSENIQLKFTVESEIETSGISLAYENHEQTEVIFNGKKLDTTPNGWYADRSIKTISLPGLIKGKNEIILKIVFHEKTDLENIMLLGKFGVSVSGRNVKITSLPDTVCWGDLSTQGLPFYGGNITYKLGKCNHKAIQVKDYKGGLISINDSKRIFNPPYITEISDADEVSITLYGNRYNTFGPLHRNTNTGHAGHPNSWRTTGEDWCYEYKLKQFGILTSPIFLD